MRSVSDHCFNDCKIQFEKKFKFETKSFLQLKINLTTELHISNKFEKIVFLSHLLFLFLNFNSF